MKRGIQFSPDVKDTFNLKTEKNIIEKKPFRVFLDKDLLSFFNSYKNVFQRVKGGFLRFK